MILPITFLVTREVGSNLKVDELKQLGYSESISIIEEKGLTNYIKDKNVYSETLDNVLIEDKYEDQFLEDYLLIDYKVNSVDDINTLLELGYTYDEINNILLLDNNEIFLNNLNQNAVEYLKYNFFKEVNIDRYIAYGAKMNTLESKDIVTRVNIGLDNEFYTNINELTLDESAELDVLSNKYNKLNKDYVPSDLTLINSIYTTPGRELYLREAAAEAFQQMCLDALGSDIEIYGGSAYRSYSTQLSLYDRYKAKYGLEEAIHFQLEQGIQNIKLD
jgi:hypothetical protein